MRALNEDYVITDRGGIIENRYAVHAAVVDYDGRLLFTVGDPSRMTLARSAAKPAQALAVLETPDFSQFGFDDADLALMCASHNSEDRHVSRAQSMLAKAGVKETDLRCGGHPAVSTSVNHAWIRSGFVPGPVHNNCSGKHAGMLAGARAAGCDPPGEYHLPDHPMQVRVKSVFEELCGVQNPDEIRWAIDGCNLPAPACSLCLLARVFVSFATAADLVSRGAVASERVYKSGRIFDAMTRHPRLIGGDTRFCTELMETFDGALIGKVGAEGCYGLGIRASEYTERLGATGAIGVAVKIEDGNIDILYSAVMEILKQLQIGTEEQRQKLKHFHCRQILNTVGVVTGHVSHVFKVQPAQ